MKNKVQEYFKKFDLTNDEGSRMDLNCNKIIPYFLVLGLGMSYLAYADNHETNSGNGSGKCNNHVKEMARLVKKYHEVTAEIATVNIELEGRKQKGDSLTDVEKLEVTSLENKIKNLTQEQKIHLDALDSKSERVIKHCPE